EMGRVVARFADRVYITDDDPHMEDPAPIRAALLEGALSVRGGGTTTEVALRQDAIREAILDAGKQDTVLLAGRGHEE
ncbi:glutamate ligase domain-containing protein, partial [Actinotignum timonense]|nr:UDP-N-acetylmuramoyl-L-alanyl-D-glutamate--2,6-diaminopimelate ligase [Actinotignum timonense]